MTTRMIKVTLFGYVSFAISDSVLDDSESGSDESSGNTSLSEQSEVDDIEDSKTVCESTTETLVKDHEASSVQLPSDPLNESKAISESVVESVKHTCNDSNKQSFHFLVCMVCLGDNDDPDDELIECDGCGIVVHEGMLYTCD